MQTRFLTGWLLSFSFILSYNLTLPVSSEVFFDFRSAYQELRNSLPSIDPVEARRRENLWASPEYPYDLRPGNYDINRADLFHSEALLRRAISYYDRAAEQYDTMQEEMGRIDKQILDVQERETFYQGLHQRALLEAQGNRLRRKYHQDLTRSLSGLFETLEKIDHHDVRADDRFHNLNKHALRLYILARVSLGDFESALNALQRYGQYEQALSEWPYHYYKASCYDALFRQHRIKTYMPESEIVEFRRKKNVHLALAAELLFGSESIEFEYVLRQIRRDEMEPVRLRSP